MSVSVLCSIWGLEAIHGNLSAAGCRLRRACPVRLLRGCWRRRTVASWRASSPTCSSLSERASINADASISATGNDSDQAVQSVLALLARNIGQIFGQLTTCSAMSARAATSSVCLRRLDIEGPLRMKGISDDSVMCSGSADGRPLVQTASEADGVLGGIMRARVLSACRRLAIPYQERAPQPSEREAWQEAFLTNRRAHAPSRHDTVCYCRASGGHSVPEQLAVAKASAMTCCSVKRLQPVRRIVSSLPEYEGPWQCDLAAAPGPITEALSAAVAEDLEQDTSGGQDTLCAC